MKSHFDRISRGNVFRHRRFIVAHRYIIKIIPFYPAFLTSLRLFALSRAVLRMDFFFFLKHCRTTSNFVTMTAFAEE